MLQLYEGSAALRSGRIDRTAHVGKRCGQGSGYRGRPVGKIRDFSDQRTADHHRIGDACNPCGRFRVTARLDTSGSIALFRLIKMRSRTDEPAKNACRTA